MLPTDRSNCWTRLRVLALAGVLLLGAPLHVAAQELPVTEVGFVFRFSPTPVAATEVLPPVLRQRLTLKLQRVTLQHALREIVARARLDLSYSRAVVSLSRVVSVDVASGTAAEALRQVLHGVPVELWITGNGKAALVPTTPEPGGADTGRGSITGRVIEAKTGSALAGVMIIVDPTALSATTGSDGRYRIADVAPGMYTVRARYIGYVPVATSATVAAGREATLDFVLAKSVQVLDEVVTTGTIIPTEVKALPTPITLIGADDINQRRPQSLADVIRQAVPAAVAFDSPSTPVETGFSVRGVSSLSGSSPMKIFVDGIEATSFGLTPIDLASIERVEVVRGPQAATLYGADAAGGVIQIFTKRGDPGLTRPQVDAQAALGLAQTPYAGHRGVLRQQYSGSVRGGGDLSYNFGASYTHLAEYLPNGELSKQSSPSVYGGMHFAHGIVTADLSARYYRNKLPSVVNPLVLAAGSVSLSRPNYQIRDFTNETYGTRITVSPTGWWRNQLTMGVDHFTVPQVQTQPRLTTPADTFYAVSNSNGRKISVGYNTSVTGAVSTALAGAVTVGVDHYDQDVSSFSTSRALNTQGTIQTSPAGSFTQSRSTITNSGYFAQVQVSLHDAVFLTGGLRAEESSTFGVDLGVPVLPRVGMSVVQRIGQATVKVRGAYGRALRAPSPGQAFGGVSPTQINLANPLLAPEQQRGWDTGIDLVFGSRGSLSVTGYEQIAEDLIAFLQVATTPLPTFQFQNIGRVANRGIEIEGTLTVQSLQVKAQYGYVKSRIEDLGPNVSPEAALQVGDRPHRTPKHTAGAALTFAPRDGTALSAGVTYIGSFPRIDVLAQLRCSGGTGPCQPTPRGYVVNFPGIVKVNATFTQRVTRHLQGFISVDNLTNNEAYEGFNTIPVIGRITMVGLQFGH